jgi:hypothetical protein
VFVLGLRATQQLEEENAALKEELAALKTKQAVQDELLATLVRQVAALRA